MKKLTLKLNDVQFNALWNESAGTFLRAEPKKRWTEKEKREAVTAYLMKFINRITKERN